MTTVAPYPAHLETDVVLRTGRTLRMRPVRADDHDRLLRFFTALSSESLRSRFFDVRSADDALRSAPYEVDYEDAFGLVGELGAEIVATAHYFRLTHRPSVAEVAFAIADRAQGRGIATRMLERLAEIASTHRIERFEADMLSDNQRMLDVFLDSGFDVKVGSREGVVHLSFAIDRTPEFEERAAARAVHAAHASMKAIFEPRSIAVVGASRRPTQLGSLILRNLKSTGFRGSLYVVNPNATEIESTPSFPALTAIPDAVDLAIIAVPAAAVEPVVDDCVTKGVRAIVVITAGFAETGTAGKELEKRLLEKVRAAGIRMVGPNCMGVINADPGVSMHATFSPVFPPPGNVAMSSQSGALGLAVLDYARSLNIGFSTFISVGNKADVSGNDLIQYWSEDPKTDVMLLYLESFGNPRKFAEIARRVSRRKPIVAVKAGRSSAGARAASSHTGALASSDVIVGELFRHAGIIRTDTLEELFDVASLLAVQPLPRGRRVAIVTNAGGPGILAADACEANGLELAPLTDEVMARLRTLLPAAASVGNPVDMIASASAEHYGQVTRLLLDDVAVDAVVVIYIPVLPGGADDVAGAIRECAANAKGKTLVATFMGARGAPASLAPAPSFPFPERAVRALARATAYAEWRRKPTGTVRRFEDLDVAALRGCVNKQLAAGGGWLDPLDVDAVLRAAGIPTARVELVRSAEEAVEASMSIGFPAVLKAQGSTLLHKTEAGAIRLALQDECAVREAFTELKDRLGDRMESAIVQRMISDGVEAMVGATHEPTFGHVIAYGAGGTLVELVSDIALRIHPLTDADVGDMLGEVRFSRLLRGYRGSAPVDVAALEEVLMRVSALLTVCPEVRELDINPLKVRQQGVAAVDARIRLEAVPSDAPSRRIAY